MVVTDVVDVGRIVVVVETNVVVVGLIVVVVGLTEVVVVVGTEVVLVVGTTVLIVPTYAAPDSSSSRAPVTTVLPLKDTDNPK